MNSSHTAQQVCDVEPVRKETSLLKTMSLKTETKVMDGQTTLSQNMQGVQHPTKKELPR